MMHRKVAEKNRSGLFSIQEYGATIGIVQPAVQGVIF
jgi:hypothetical protein